MKHTILFSMILALVCSCSGCRQDAVTENLLSRLDSVPPVLLETSALSTSEATLLFNEEISQATASCEENPVSSLSLSLSRVTVRFSRPLKAGECVTLSGRVKDKRGNSTRFSTPIWARNPHPAGLRINEFTTKGTSGSQPDRVELLVTKNGNLSGITLADGPRDLAGDRCVLPDVYVWKGEYVVVRFQEGKGEGYPSEKLAGLGGNNGTIVLFDSPFPKAKILDAVAYSNKTGLSADGWGTEEVRLKVEALVEEGAWGAKEASRAVDSGKSTSTRSMNRRKGEGTKSGDDWYICPQGEASFGKENSPNVYH